MAGCLGLSTSIECTIDASIVDVNYADTALWQPVGNDIQMNIQTTGPNDANIHEVSGDLVIGAIKTQGNTWLRAAGGIQSAVVGATIQLDASSFFKTLPVLSLTADLGNIGTETAPINILTTWQASFSAKTLEDVFLHSQKDLAVNSDSSRGDAVIKFDPGFSMVDVDFHDEIDQRAIAVLKSTVWEDLQLTKETGFDAKSLSRIADLEAIKTSEYRTYWALRNQTPAPGQYTSAARVLLSEEKVADLRPTLAEEGTKAGKSGDALEQYIRDAVKKIEDERTAELHRLHLVVGAFTPAFNPEYKYKATDADKKQIDDSMHLWTEQQLLNLRNASFVASFLKITDTELVIEQPNIVGQSVTIENAYGVGSYDHSQTIVLKDAEGKQAKLTLDQRAAVVAAETGDLIFTTQAPVAVVVSVQDNYNLKLEGYTKNQDAPYGDTSSTWSDLGFQVGQSIMLAGDPGSTTDRGVFYKVKSFSVDGMTLEVEPGTAALPTRPVKTRKIGSDNFLPKEFGEYLVAPVITNPEDYKNATHTCTSYGVKM